MNVKFRNEYLNTPQEAMFCLLERHQLEYSFKLAALNNGIKLLSDCHIDLLGKNYHSWPSETYGLYSKIKDGDDIYLDFYSEFDKEFKKRPEDFYAVSFDRAYAYKHIDQYDNLCVGFKIRFAEVPVTDKGFV